jgi:hypothetical protein
MSVTVPSVNFFGDAGKYVVLRVTFPDGTIRTLVRGRELDERVRLHRDIAARAKGEHGLEGADIEVLGGGFFMRSEDGVLRLHGRSTDFGAEPDRAATVALVRAAHPDRDVRAM